MQKFLPNAFARKILDETDQGIDLIRCKNLEDFFTNIFFDSELNNMIELWNQDDNVASENV